MWSLPLSLSEAAVGAGVDQTMRFGLRFERCWKAQLQLSRLRFCPGWPTQLVWAIFRLRDFALSDG